MSSNINARDDKQEEAATGMGHDDEENQGCHDQDTTNGTTTNSVEQESEKFDLMDIVVARCNTNQGERPNNRLTKEEEKLLAYNKNHNEASKNNKEEDSNSHDTGRQDGWRKRPPRINTGGDQQNNNIKDSTTTTTTESNRNQNQVVEESEEFDVMNVVRARARGQLTTETTMTTKHNNKMNSMDYLNGLRMSAAKMAMKEEDEASPPTQQEEEEGEATSRNPIIAGASAAATSKPGAYSGMPGEDLQRNDKVQFSLVGAAPQNNGVEDQQCGGQEDQVINSSTTAEEDGITTSAADGSSSINRKLPAAALVRDEESILLDVNLQPVDVDAAESNKAKQEKQRKLFVGISTILLAMALIIVLVSIFVIQNNKNSSDVAAQSPTVAVPSLPSSEAPSSAPTGVLDTFIKSLPDSTQERLNNVSSPQWKARVWLEEYPNITALEEWKKKQLFGLVTFYYSFEGRNWPGGLNEDWLKYERDECNWWSYQYGGYVNEFILNLYNRTKDDCGRYEDFGQQHDNSSCDLSTGRILYLDIGRIGALDESVVGPTTLDPKIPPEISLLSDLERIAIVENGFNASLQDLLPSELSELSNLTHIYIVGNENIGGSIPSTLGVLTQLTDLYLQSDYITGQLPSQIGHMTSMEYIQIAAEGLNGRIPSTLSHMSSLEILSLMNCSLGGSIPSQLGLLTNLKQIQLPNNQLTGAVPSEIFALPLLENFILKGNAIEPSLVVLSSTPNDSNTAEVANNSTVCHAESGNLTTLVQLRPQELVFRVDEDDPDDFSSFYQTFEMEITILTTGSNFSLSSLRELRISQNFEPFFFNLTTNVTTVQQEVLAEGKSASISFTGQQLDLLPSYRNTNHDVLVNIMAVAKNEITGEESSCQSAFFFVFEGGIPLSFAWSMAATKV